jgi:pimeloyl-ACP methyl ester carboxylesterase
MSGDEEISIGIVSLSEWEVEDGQTGKGLSINTTRGRVKTLIHHDSQRPTSKAVLWVCGASGGLDGPADRMYKKLGEELSPEITSLRVDYRYPGDLTESVMDTLSAVSFLSGTGHQDILLVGHSFGGAVVISAAPFSEQVRGVIALSSQTAGASNVADVSPRSLLLIHGEEDVVLAHSCSEMIFEWADQPKELLLMPGTGHRLSETSDDVRFKVKSWIQRHLKDIG